MFTFEEFSGSTAILHDDPQGRRRPDRGQLQHIELLGRCEELTGLSLSVIDTDLGQFISGPCSHLARFHLGPLIQTLQKASVHVATERGLILYGLQIPGTPLIAGGVLVNDNALIPELEDQAAQNGFTQESFTSWVTRHSGIRPDVARRLLDSAQQIMAQHATGTESVQTRDAVVHQLGQIYEEVTLIQDLSQYLRPDVDPLILMEAVLERIELITGVELGAICLQHAGNKGTCLNGDWGMSASDLQRWLNQELGGRSPHILVRNNLRTEHNGGRLRCIAAVPLFVEDADPSWIVIANTKDRRELGTEEANLLRSVGSIIAAQIRVVELFREQDTMVLAFIRSLVASLDAKDSYTRGHSERVALVAERIARQMQLPEPEVRTIFQSGLLHDLGKIGVSDAVLQKSESLSPEEFHLIAKHPEVGHQILSELRNLSTLLPGVRHHHERFDGRGYPDQLAGKSIPRMARILAVADSFDAMGSNRPYRSGKPIEVVERILAEGAGKQWDPDVIQAYFDARLDIHRIWNQALERMNPPESTSRQTSVPSALVIAMPD
ncbi:MAG: HD-GYP domain-containing protein [Planctomycetota bacterium]|nr:MAG: HD-GYP domain-containing protein [Planctomycetota bacterium]